MGNITKLILVTYPDRFRLDEAKSLAESLPHCKVIKIFTQRYLDRAEYG
jgi:GTP-binding protein HflX